MKFTLIHPSRGRKVQANHTLAKWIESSSGKYSIEHIYSLDSDDPEALEYEKYLPNSVKQVSEFSTQIVISDNENVVQATNRSAELATGDIIIYLSDDFDCPEAWDQLIIDKVKLMDSDECWLLKVDDCLQEFSADVLTIPIVSMALYKRLGYFWHPHYQSMFVDQDLYHTVKNMGALFFAQDLKFPHNHFSVGKAHEDATYTRSTAHWKRGKKLYAKRKAAKFPREWPISWWKFLFRI